MGYRRPDKILGFSPHAAATQWQIELEAMTGLLPERFEYHLRHILQWPREAGRAGDHRAAEYIAQRLRELGYDAELIPYRMYLRYPGHVRLKIVEPTPYTFSFAEDPPSRYPDAVPGGFVAFAASGNVQAPVVYANACTLDDLERLEQAGIDVRGKVLLIRLGHPAGGYQLYSRHQFEIAEDAGAAGCVFYRDPAEDGFVKGAVYPDGPWRNANSVFRTNGRQGRPGDVRSPGWPATLDAPRLPESEIQLPRLPAASISYGEARRILEALDGPEAPAEMQGGFDFRYRLGGGSPIVHLDVNMVGEDYLIHDVVANVSGRDAPDQRVYMGTHHDSWDGGAHDNAGGVAALLAVAESLAPMLRRGYRPRRSIMLCSFDAEEVGYGGSTEYVEAHLHEMQRGGVAHVYVDGFTSGTQFDPESVSPALEPLFDEILHGLRDPIMDASLHEASVQRHGRIEFKPPGTVDTLPFYHIAGIPSSYHKFGGPNGVTHSAHDTLEYVHKQDPGHRFSVACMQVWVCAGLRLANAELLPVDYRGYARGYCERLADLTAQTPEPRLTAGVDRLGTLLERYSLGAASIAQAVEAWTDGRWTASPDTQRSLCELMVRMERDLLTDEGPRETPWYRHTFASPPDRSTGYQLATFPDLTRGLRQGDWARAAKALGDLQAVFMRATATQEAFAAIVRTNSAPL